MTEMEILNSIMAELSKYGICFRCNVAGLYTKDGRYIPPCLPKGHSDLVFYRAFDGKACFVEVKTSTGKASKDQLNFIKQMLKIGCNAGIARNIDEALKICEVVK